MTGLLNDYGIDVAEPDRMVRKGWSVGVENRMDPRVRGDDGVTVIPAEAGTHL